MRAPETRPGGNLPHIVGLLCKRARADWLGAAPQGQNQEYTRKAGGSSRATSTSSKEEPAIVLSHNYEEHGGLKKWQQVSLKAWKRQGEESSTWNGTKGGGGSCTAAGLQSPRDRSWKEDTHHWLPTVGTPQLSQLLQSKPFIHLMLLPPNTYAETRHKGSAR